MLGGGGDVTSCSYERVREDCAEEYDDDEEEHTCEQLQQIFTTIDLKEGKENAFYADADCGRSDEHGSRYKHEDCDNRASLSSPLRETNMNLDFSPILSARQRGKQQRSQVSSSVRDSHTSEPEVTSARI